MPPRAWELRLSASSPAVLETVATAARDGRALLLGSTVRGVLRHGARRFAAARGQACADAPGCGCPVCAIFGRADATGRLEVRSDLAEADVVEVAHVSIDRRRRTADRSGRRLVSHRAASATFVVRVTLVEAPAGGNAGGSGTDGLESFLEAYLSWVEATGIALGRRRSAGAGQFRVEVHRAPDLPPPVAVDDVPATTRAVAAAPGTRLAVIRIVTLEPIRIVGRAARVFYREALDVIPASTLRGAIGWALSRRGDDEGATDLFAGRPIRIGPAVAVDGPEGGPGRAVDPTPWLGVSRCRGPERHVVDTTWRRIAAALEGVPFEPVCPTCGESLKAEGAPSPTVEVIGQTEIDPVRSRAAAGRLRFQVLLAAGQAFEAVVEAEADQLERIGGLGEVLIGGNRSRGVGRASIGVVPLEPAAGLVPLSAGAGADGPRPAEIAVLGLPGDVSTPEPVVELLGRAGLDPVISDVRVVERGGWDGRSAQLRPIRRLLSAGSWIAVRPADGSDGLDRALPRLAEALDAIDREDLDRLWLVERREVPR
ncbi:RAMP superfamily CRISPR-associated protein [Rhabdothermincola sediminis]|uniref:RAMP superfamily CRISPR-associated protein n=1 Tax=Rhabdothermincola sediminis TaxID=2751370 RepID=UPI001AA01364|nr:RAMP superfamily CRISPR-associated protein [Rhabdothermincola sediminis]